MFTAKTTTRSLIIFISAINLLVALLGSSPVFSATADDEDLYQRARDAFNDDRFREAERMYRRVASETEDDDLAADAYYWRAYSLYRLGGARDLDDAARTLDQLHEHYPDADTMPDADRLYDRIERALAKQGRTRDADERERSRHDRDEHGRDREREHDRNESKLMALSALMQMDPERAIPVLRKIIADDRPENAELREHALMMLTHNAPDEAEDILIDIVTTDEDPELVAMAIFWLSQTDGERSFAAIEQAFQNHKDDEVREAALFALGHHGGSQAVAFLKNIVVDPDMDSEVREYALFSLAQSGADGLVDIYMQIFEMETDSEVRSMVLFSMAQLDEDIPQDWFVDIIKDEGEDREVREQALHAATMMDLVDVPFLRQVYNASDDEEMKEMVLFALSRIDEPEALDLMIEIIRNTDDPELRENAIFMLSRFDDDRAADLLLEIINGED